MLKKVFAMGLTMLILTGCDNYGSVTLKEVMNDKTSEERDKIMTYLKSKLSDEHLLMLTFDAQQCRLTQAHRDAGLNSSDLNEFCHMTLDEYVNEYVKKNKNKPLF